MLPTPNPSRVRASCPQAIGRPYGEPAKHRRQRASRSSVGDWRVVVVVAAAAAAALNGRSLNNRLRHRTWPHVTDYSPKY